ncbi:nascent polypeptide-associated complex subunit alpha, muscle-specific form [Austrofundulus limnaeus]|uniref:Nascent polypeptide-associated complex subunit alpha, muscle-specific form n=1 Tax=Austrofundulus limnaeus TaxID=52670 RepID=A0A2I4CWH3_AUSLI|nr:PREDICTED: nascent polypeptide-associated complex subunit alpha, muscle-specific form-like [Austrofundulus limnaeus]
MDVRLQGDSQLYRLNGGARQNSRLGQDNTLQYLSREEKECLQFFEDTIESLEESLEVDNRRPRQVTLPRSRGDLFDRVDGVQNLSSNHSVNASSHQDIIDLVHQKTNVNNQEPTFNPANPDFQHLLPAPESHFEVKPIRDSLPSEYDRPLPGGSYGSTDGYSSYHPPGSVPTPVLIARKIAENKGEGSAVLHPSTLLRRLSSASDKAGNRSNVHAKHAAVKHSRYPSNININYGNKEQHNSAPNLNLHERQVLSNLPAISYPLMSNNTQQATEQTEQNTPTRCISFNDPEPDKSRMEALSKLGLDRKRASSFHKTPDNTSKSLTKNPDSSAKTVEPSVAPVIQKGFSSPEQNASVPPPSYFHSDRKIEMSPTYPPKSHAEKSYQEKPSSPTAAPHSPPSTDVTKLAFNSYGGKSVIVHPAVSPKNESTTHPTSPEPKSPTLSYPIELNSYGGKSKVMAPAPASAPAPALAPAPAPAPAPVTRTNLPDILSSHIDKTQSMPPKLEPQLAELNSYGGKSRSINLINRSSQPISSSVKSAKSPPPATAPRPPRSSYQGMNFPPKSPARALSPDHKRKPSSMFRPQGITVQFCGRGAMDDSRRDALRKLGLFKD